MNEITKAAAPAVQLKPVQVPSAAGKPAKGSGAPAEQVVKPVDADKLQERIEAAVKQMNEYIQSTQRDLHFSYDRNSGETIVKVLDRTTQEVIRQIPDETFLKLAVSRDAEGNFQLFSAQA